MFEKVILAEIECHQKLILEKLIAKQINSGENESLTN